MDAMPNTGFGSKQPDMFGRNTNQSFGQGNPMTLGAVYNKPVGGFNPDLYMAYGGDIPMYQGGGITPEKIKRARNEVKNPFLTRQRMLEYKKENPEATFWGETEGSRDPSTGYWDRVAFEWDKPWMFGSSEEEQMYTDPRQIQAQKNLIPGGSYFGIGDDLNPLEYLQNAFLLPQKGINKMLTGYYETPSQTVERYGDDMGLWGTALDVALDPMMYPELPIMATKAALTGATKYGTQAAKATADFTKKYGKKAYQKVAKYLDKLDPVKVMNILGYVKRTASQAGAHYDSGLSDEDIVTLVKEAMAAEAPANMSVAPQAMPSTRQAQAPAVNLQQANPYTGMSTEELNAILSRRYGGNMPDYQGGGDTPIMKQPYYSPDQRRAIAMELARRNAGDLMNPMGNIFSQPQAAQVSSGTPYINSGTPYINPGSNNFMQMISAGFTQNPVTGEWIAPEEVTNVSDAIKEKAKQSTEGVTPNERKEIEDAKKQVDDAKEEAIKETQPNYKETEGDETVTTDGQTYYTQQPQTGFYGGPGFKYKARGSYIDPETGKRVRVREKFKSPTGGDFFGFGRSGSPRKIKNTYNIYNNPYMYQMPGVTTPTTPAAQDTGLTPEQIAGRAAEEQYGQYLRAMQDDTATAEAQEAADMDRVQPRGLTADQYNPQPIPTEPPLWSRKDYMNLPSMQEMGSRGAAAYYPMDFSNPYDAMQDLQRGYSIPMAYPEPEMPINPGANIRGFAYGGNIPMAQMGINNQFSEDRYSTFLDDANSAVSQGFAQPASTGESVYSTGPQSGSYIENGKVMVYGEDPQKTGQIKEKVKKRGRRLGWDIAGEMLLPTANLIAGLAEYNQMQEPLTDVNQFVTSTGMKQGSSDINKNQFVDTVYPQDSGNYGAANAKYGGAQPQYENGGVYDLTPDEIERVLAMGGSIEYM
jgi:hypothetical protein